MVNTVTAVQKTVTGVGDAGCARWHCGVFLKVLALVMLGGAGCSLDGVLHSDELPKDVSDPAITETPQGALTAYNGALAQFRDAFGGNGPVSAILASALRSDELMAPRAGNMSRRMLDQRIPYDSASNSYSELQKVRGQAQQALGLLVNYLPGQPVLIGHLYAIQGYVEVLLAELFCSGIPLSTLDFDGDFTYRPGSTTEQVFTHAVALFDTALSLAGDSARIMDMARVGRARALLGLARYADAAATVGAVASNARYVLAYNNVTSGSTSAQNFATKDVLSNTWNYTVPNLEGNNGIDWRTSGDPRTPIVAAGTIDLSGGGVFTQYYPSSYDPAGATSLVLASGIEARLIEAEAALQDGSTAWLTILNALRTDGTFETRPTTDPNDDPAATYPHWYAGSGGVAGLAPLTDPEVPSARVDLLFRERAFWLFLTAHRQGDLRRLIRQYDRIADQVYPVGGYLFSSFLGEGSYGSAVAIRIPVGEFINPLYSGCLSLD